MRAVVVREFGGIDKAALGDMPKPELTPDGVLLDVHAASVNFVDLVVMGGTYQFSPKLPYIPGKLPVGIVAAVGTGGTVASLRTRLVAETGTAQPPPLLCMPISQSTPSAIASPIPRPLHFGWSRKGASAIRATAVSSTSYCP